MDIRKKKIAFLTLGCKVNTYESEAMMQILRDSGAEIVSFDETADVYVINTCSVTNIADRKSRQMLHQARKKNPGAVIAAVGCYVQEKGEQILAEENVDIVIGNGEKRRIGEILENYSGERWTAFRDPADNDGYERMEIGDRIEKGRAFIKIQDGCDQFCSYCIIPLLRGRICSRDEEDTLREIRKMTEKGFREIVLTGIHLSSYGLDRDGISYERAAEQTFPSQHLLRLLKRISDIEDVDRIRLGSLEPRIITEEFLQGIKMLPKVCPHFHLSLQSGCDKTLVKMNRHYDSAFFRETMERLRRYYPMAAITTDVIVGFPGETETDFLESRDFVEEMNFYELHVFRYSRRKGTRADRMQEQIPEKEKSRRSEILCKMNAVQSEAYRAGFIGKTSEIIPEDIIAENGNWYLRGYNPEYVRFLVPVETKETAEKLIGKKLRVFGEVLNGMGVLALKPEMI